MIKEQIKLGIIIILSSIILAVPLLYLVKYFEVTKVLVLNIIGPLLMMTSFVGLFILLAGIMKKKDDHE